MRFAPGRLLSMLLLTQVAGLTPVAGLTQVAGLTHVAEPARLTCTSCRSGWPVATVDAASAPEVLLVNLKDALGSGINTAASMRGALLSGKVEGEELVRALCPLVGAGLAPRVAGLAQSPVSQTTSLGDFENRAVELMQKERWLEAHDVVAGELLGSPSVEHAHEAMAVARLLEGVCQHQLACPGGLAAALAAHEVDMNAQYLRPLPCGCVVSLNTIEPFADLARALTALDAGEPNAALGHALAAGLGRATLAPTAACIAARAESELELDISDTLSGVVYPTAEELGRTETGESEASRGSEKEEEELPALAALQSLVGLQEVKQRCHNLRDAVALEKERGDDPKQRSFSLVLTGNPGTGKSRFAKLEPKLEAPLWTRAWTRACLDSCASVFVVAYPTPRWWSFLHRPGPTGSDRILLAALRLSMASCLGSSTCCQRAAWCA